MIKENLRLKTKDIAFIGLMISIIEVVKVSLSFVPGVEIVSLLFVIYTLFFEEKIIYVLSSFCLIEGILYGFGIWWFAYLYIWTMLVIVVYLFRKYQSVWFWSALLGIYGFLFGFLFVPVYLVTGGIGMAVSWWISGITVDIIHGISNFVLCLVLFKPLDKAVKMLK